MTNALRAQIVVALNAILSAIVAFGINLTTAQAGAASIALNALLGVWVAITYQSSPRRTPDTP